MQLNKNVYTLKCIVKTGLIIIYSMHIYELTYLGIKGQREQTVIKVIAVLFADFMIAYNYIYFFQNV